MSYVHYPVVAVMSLFLGAFLVEIFGSRNRSVCKAIAMIFVTIPTVLIALLVKPVLLNGEIISYWMGNWEPVSGWAIGIGYEIDQLGMFFALLVVTTFFLSAVYSLRYMERDDHVGHYYTLFLMLSGSVLGLVLTGDLFNLFIMIEIMTFSAAALAAFRNMKSGSLEAGFKYLVIGSIGSSFTLFGVALVYLQTHTLNMAQISNALQGNLTPVTILALGMILTGFGVKSYIVPFHTPAADSYTTAPTSISMVFAGMVNKAGVYGMIRILYIVFTCMDNSAIQMLMVIIGSITMFVGVTMALAQHDFKRLLAFHSISQIGYVITSIGLGTALGITGGLFHAMNHTLFKGLLFLCAGAVLYSTGTTNLDKLGGLSKRMPKTCVCFLIGAFSISGLPPFNGFASKWIVYQAAYSKALETGNFLYVIATVTAVVVSVMTLASFIKVTQAVFFGQLSESNANVQEVPLSMRVPMYIMSALCVLGGVFYKLVNTWLLNPAVNATLSPNRYYGAMFGGLYQTADIPAVTFNVWDPVLWLILFVVILAAVCIFLLLMHGDKGRTVVNAETLAEVDGKHSVFFGGEKALYSHVGGSDLFWGFKKNWTGYFKFMQGMHSGNINDYATYVAIAGVIIILFVLRFVH